MSYPVYESYRKSGVEWLGDIPKHWEVRRLRFNTISNPVKSEVNHLSKDQNVSFVPMEAVGEYGGLKLDKVKSIEDVYNGYTYFKNGDVLIAKITPCFENGKGSVATNLKNGVAFGTTELHVLRPENNFDSQFLFYLSISDAFRKIGASEMF